MVSESPAATSMASPKLSETRLPSCDTFTGTGLVPSNALAELAAPWAIVRESVRNFSLPQRSLTSAFQTATLLLLRKGPPTLRAGKRALKFPCVSRGSKPKCCFGPWYSNPQAARKTP